MRGIVQLSRATGDVNVTSGLPAQSRPPTWLARRWNSAAQVSMSSPQLVHELAAPGAGEVLSPWIVRLATRRATDLVNEVQFARDLVAREVCPAMRGQLFQRQPVTRSSLHDGRDAASPALVGHADDDRIEHRGMRLQHAFDLIGEDLLASRVDARRTAPEQPNRAVRLDGGEITGNGPAAPVDLD